MSGSSNFFSLVHHVGPYKRVLWGFGVSVLTPLHNEWGGLNITDEVLIILTKGEQNGKQLMITCGLVGPSPVLSGTQSASSSNRETLEL